MKYNKFLAFLIMLSFIGCDNSPKIIQKEYKYEKMLFGTHLFSFDFHLENIENSSKIYNLINNLIYDNKNFDEYVEYKERSFVGDIKKEDYPPITNEDRAGHSHNPPMTTEDGTEYFYNSEFSEKYSIIFKSNTHIIFEYNSNFYNSGAAHGNYLTKYFVIDLVDEKILDIADLVSPIPDDLLKEMIASNYNEIHFSRENIWAPDAINFCNENIELIWNIYTIAAYSNGMIRIEIQNDIIEPYLTDKGKALRNIIAEYNNR